MGDTLDVGALGLTGRGMQSVGSVYVPGPSPGAHGRVELSVGERGGAAAAVRRKRSSGSLLSDAGEQETHHGSLGVKDARMELEPVAAASSQEDVWGCDRPD